MCIRDRYGLNTAATVFDGKTKYIRITDIDEVTNRYSPNPVVSPQSGPVKEYKLNYGDLLFTRTGASTGKAYLYDSKDGDLYFAGFLIRFPIANASPAFVFNSVKSDQFSNWVRVMSMRSGQPGINAQEYSSFKFAAPAMPEQKKIAEFLGAVDEKIRLLQSRHEQLTLYKKGVMHKIFAQAIRFKADDGSDFPDWEFKRLSEIASRSTEKNKHDEHSRVLTNSAVLGIIDQRDYFDKDIANAKNLDGYYIVTKGDFVYNPRISATAPVGPIKRNHLGDGVMSPLYSVFRFNSKSADFYEQYFETSHWHKYMKSVANYGARHDRMAISTNDFLAMPLPALHPDEQQKIADFLSAIDEKIEAVSAQIENMQSFKKGLLQQMFV